MCKGYNVHNGGSHVKSWIFYYFFHRIVCMIFVNLIAYLIFIYLIVYSIYFLTFVIKSFGAKKYIEEQYSELNATSAENKLCVIIWADGRNKNLFGLLDSLNNQTYAKENYDVNVIYKNSSREKTPVPDFAHGARIHSIENPEFFSKNKAITTFLERIIENSNQYDAFVFLGADRLIGANYLEIINRKITPGNVLTGSLSIVEADEKTLPQKLFTFALQAKAELTNNSINVARAMFGLCHTIDGENCVIAGDVIERIGMVCFETKNDQLKYSLFLASNDIRPLYYPLIATGVEAQNFNAGTPSLKQAFSLFKHYLKTIHKKSWYFVEYLASTFRPTTLFLLTSYFLLFFLNFGRPTIEIKYVVHLGLFLILIMVASIVAARLAPKKILYLLLSPIPLFIAKFIRISRKISKKTMKKQYEEEINVESATVNSFVTNGKKDVSCKLDLVSEEGMRKVVFRYKKKRFESDAHLRMCDALGDLTRSLDEKGFTLKVCQNCVHYNPENDTSVDQITGYCNVGVGVNIASGDSEESGQILIWSCCNNFIKGAGKDILGQ